MRLLSIALVLVAGCFDPEPGFYSCTDSEGCPDGWSCHSDQRCYPDPEADMGVADLSMPDMQVGDMFATDMPDECIPEPQRPVDLLLVVDNSMSMMEEQLRLKDSVRGLLEALALGRDAEGTVGAFAPVEDLHVGVITTDIGAGPTMLPGGVCPMPGDDGILLNETRSGAATCSDTFETRFLTYDPGVGINALADDLTCLASVGLDGCGFEQQLEAMARALVPSTNMAIDRGKADGPNDGFLREGSVLIVSVVTDESDCSAADLDLFNQSSTMYDTDLNLRCGEHADEALHPISRYVDTLLTYVRGTRDTDVIFAPLVGVPPDLVGEDWDVILADDSQQFVVDPGSGVRFTPSCESDGTSAQPAPRFVELSKLFEEQGGHSVLGSICDGDYASYFASILDALEPLLEVDTCEP
ncbi:MAG: hypothetical protein JJ863_05780 [Deltaproteobacteria bacterium]|nr:hypothetical protein [Deltaproteobacteria bacterium]